MTRIRSWASRSWWRFGLLVIVGGFLVIQLVPYGRSHANPSVTKGIAWDSQRTQDLFNGACGDCHSNLTTWPVESNVAPMSWLIQHDVDEGRNTLNVSEWDRPQQPDLGQVTSAIQEGEMPPLQYKVLHPGGRLSDSEKADLVAGLTKTYSSDPPGVAP